MTVDEAIESLSVLWSYPHGTVTVSGRLEDQVFHITLYQWEELRQAVCVLREAYYKGKGV